ncbi:hypothetical protein IAD21_00615 [Abditibacteriota bacterium]|nr:hypothetical protein IAD21_00615 [Abditibacteriota bacterium]
MTSPRHDPFISALLHRISLKERSLNLEDPFIVAGEQWCVDTACTSEIVDVFQTLYRVDMEIVNTVTSNHFDLSIYVYWEEYYPGTTPPKDVLFGLIRNLICDHLTDHRYPPRFSSKGYIELRWPEQDEHDGTV